MNTQLPKTGTPEIKNRSFLEVVDNFTDPREVLREAISNALDWDATSVRIVVSEDFTRNRELVIRIRDNGIGLNEARFKAFWNLADSPELQYDEFGKKVGGRTGEKGYGTKTYWKCRQLEVESVSRKPDGTFWHVFGIMTEPINTLRQGQLPPYRYDDQTVGQQDTFTQITISGYQVQSRDAFRHEVLKD